MIDVNSGLRKDCPMRHENGNCTTCGGFCTAVNDPICEGLHSAYDAGWHAALRAKMEAEKNNALAIEADRDKWKRRAEAAERDLHGTCWSCVHSKSYEVLPGCTAYQCDYHDSITDRVFRFNCEDWKWRGLCAENGGAEDGDQADPV